MADAEVRSIAVPVSTASHLNDIRGLAGSGSGNRAPSGPGSESFFASPDPMISGESDRLYPQKSTTISDSNPLVVASSDTSASGISAGPRAKPGGAMVVTNRWEGSVLEIGDGYFDAKLSPVSGAGPDLIAAINTADLAGDELDLLRIGASLYVTAGQIALPGGRLMKTSIVHFRRLGRWRADEIADIDERAEKRRAALGFD
jgi:hypothetical protein